MKDWLRYCNWYYRTAMDPEVDIKEFFNAPMVSRKWKITLHEPTVARFGLLWKVFDMVALKGLDFKVPILDDSKSPLSGYLLGGVKLRVQISSLLALVVTSRGQV